mmetsp:Transcript_80203/g.214842  ORF Transcript_80203/g.214842 Transcript_80203/m.214842 type:complete len:222 (-) Transcript_80203:21-686(-)
MVITPSLVTFSMALASRLPISFSPLAEMVATWAMRSVPSTFTAILVSSSMTALTADSMPRRTSVGFMPAATALQPSRKMLRVKTVAVVVPSPASSLVLLATERTNAAPRLIARSRNSISFATLTPSLVIRGAPYAWSRMTLRPFGPRVTLTASASLSTPINICARASTPKRISLPDAIERAGMRAAACLAERAANEATRRVANADCISVCSAGFHTRDVFF